MSPAATDTHGSDPTESPDVVRSIVERTVFTPVRQGSAVAETVERLGQAIGMGLLRPGERLPPEARLAEDLGIAPVTLRSALAILREDGSIETQRGRYGGNFVSAGPPARSSPGRLPTEGEVRDLVDYRCVVEGGAAALAAARATPAQVQHLEALCAEMRQTHDFDSWSERDTLFHLLVADASGSRRLVAQVAEIRTEVYRIAQLATVPRLAVELADGEHREIAAAVGSRRARRARKAMVAHIESTRALWLGLGRASLETITHG
jgi:DNA-binding FadR family transcriptional regulator